MGNRAKGASRRVQIRDYERHTWVDAIFPALKKGTVFRLLEPDGTPIKNTNGQTWLLAVADAERIDGVWQVRILN